MQFRTSPVLRASLLALPAYALAVAAVAFSAAPDDPAESGATPLQSAAPPVPGSHAVTYPNLFVPSSDLALPDPEDPASAAEQPSFASRSQLTHDEVQVVLRAAGWPADLLPAATAVAWCESKWSPGALGDGGRSVGLFQLNLGTWFPYAGMDPNLWNDPIANARVAFFAYTHDLSRGQLPWNQWSCKP